MSGAIRAEDFADLSAFAALPRLGSLALSPDGTRLVTVVAELSPDGKAWQGALWEVDPAGERPARRLTRGAKGESSPVFTPDGSLLFLSARPDPAAKPADGKARDRTALWLLPPVGEARELLRPAGGVERVAVARDAGTLLLTAGAHPTAEFGEADEALRKSREDAGVTAILHESYPIRYWDADLGPGYPRLLTTALDPAADRLDPAGLVDLTPRARARLDDSAAISPDGRWVVHTERVAVSASYGSRVRLRLAAADGSSSRVLADVEGHSFGQAVFLPDSSGVIAVRALDSTPDAPWHNALVRISLDGAVTDLAPDFPEEPEHPVVSPDGAAVYFTSSHRGHQPIWRLDLASGALVRLTASGAYTDVQVGAEHVYALRNALDQPAQPVRLAPAEPEQEAVPLPAPGRVESLPGTLTEVETVVADGRTVRAWLVLPPGCSPERPAPLLLWVHGGPVMSWSGWSWRWNPWLMAARGYAVLLPDPALSTGYGQEFIRAGWGSWGAKPYTDLMAITDVAVRREDVDESRTAAMGGSFGGYMANWIATRTDRFKAIVTHASLWHLDSFTGTTDDSYYWIREMGDPLRQQEQVRANSPHLGVADIKTPMLVIHGDKDYRVPIGEGQRLYFDLVRHGVPAKFLYYPTENHWILTPGNSAVWYETIFAFLAENVLGEPWRRPDLL
ncbi:S9 family peptidase [Saccharothrix algeriensis]|uniref:Dipeptidyl aminopeptidase/acylaminoacyl peptidase n=1 Tax=Saccharothrix algeriensis TaxID=173560 RepID=A0A8T8I1G6_9PSEU|nr:S9 family peptidase [Saccharothrix algeriensis]MBM7810693.1 dipeptidyl aminopeptidase/acylaminoacyl peptidase [Saccharothrix algeriensis]QTR04763.1 S9 family peptidase [Saccharothrix algeriensis]